LFFVFLILVLGGGFFGSENMAYAADDGEACVTNADCNSGDCSNDPCLCTGARCDALVTTPAGSLGASCSSEAACTYGQCDTGNCYGHELECALRPATSTSRSLGDGGEDRTSPSDFGLQNPLGTTDFRSIMSRIIRAVLGVVGALFLAMFVYGGVKWMISTDAKGIDSAKKTLVNAVVGMVIVSFSYSMVAIIFSLAGQVTRGG